MVEHPAHALPVDVVCPLCAHKARAKDRVRRFACTWVAGKRRGTGDYVCRVCGWSLHVREWLPVFKDHDAASPEGQAVLAYRLGLLRRFKRVQMRVQWSRLSRLHLLLAWRHLCTGRVAERMYHSCENDEREV